MLKEYDQTEKIPQIHLFEAAIQFADFKAPLVIYFVQKISCGIQPKNLHSHSYIKLK